MGDEIDRLLRPSEVAAIFSVTTKTVQRWALTGALDSVVLPSGHRRYRESLVRNLLAGEDNSKFESYNGR